MATPSIEPVRLDSRFWDAAIIEGSREEKDCTISYRLGGRTVAVAAIGRDLMNLKVEAEMEASLLPSRAMRKAHR
jgi:hypothetical protein